MPITINKDSFPRFTKRLKKSLDAHVVLPLSQVQNIAAQSLGKENHHELMKIFDATSEQSSLFNQLNALKDLPTLPASTQKPCSSSIEPKEFLVLSEDFKKQIIESAAIKSGMSMGRPGWAIGSDHIEEAIDKVLAELNKNTVSKKDNQINLTYYQVKQLMDYFGEEKEGEVTISFSKTGHSGKGVYVWATEYPEDGAGFLAEEDNK